jgi:hypothetical protein
LVKYIISITLAHNPKTNFETVMWSKPFCCILVILECAGSALFTIVCFMTSHNKDGFGNRKPKI